MDLRLTETQGMFKKVAADSLAPKVVKDHQGTSFMVVEWKLRPKPVSSLSALSILLT